MSRQSFVTLKIEEINVTLVQLVQYALYTCFFGLWLAEIHSVLLWLLGCKVFSCCFFWGVCVLFLQLLLFLSGTGVEVVCKFLPRNVPIPVPQITLTKNELVDRGWLACSTYTTVNISAGVVNALVIIFSYPRITFEPPLLLLFWFVNMTCFNVHLCLFNVNTKFRKHEFLVLYVLFSNAIICHHGQTCPMWVRSCKYVGKCLSK